MLFLKSVREVEVRIRGTLEGLAAAAAGGAAEATAATAAAGGGGEARLLFRATAQPLDGELLWWGFGASVLVSD
jgi:hypothetical protein